ncbi:MAG: hypothetical protein IRZ03_16380 [Acidobacterium ailaaui]|nr:hypothetical protein [Pseudacidobacterium ailaaui]
MTTKLIWKPLPYRAVSQGIVHGVTRLQVEDPDFTLLDLEGVHIIAESAADTEYTVAVFQDRPVLLAHDEHAEEWYGYYAPPGMVYEMPYGGWCFEAV